jgi:NTP pyrophosphatase (non-canonical NTP hydrolase)
METAIYPNVGNNITYPALGLANEAGEVCGKIKKIFRDDNEILTEERKKQIIDELGDTMWYIAAICLELNIWLKDVCELNIQKLENRVKNNTLHGDNRKENIG